MQHWQTQKILHLLIALLLSLLLGLLISYFCSFSGLATLCVCLSCACLYLTGVWAWNLWFASHFIRWLADETTTTPLPRFATKNALWSELARKTIRALHTKDKQIQQAQNQLQKMLDALEVAPLGILLLDSQNRVSWGNPCAAHYLDLSFPQDMQQHITNLLRQPAFIDYLSSPKNHDDILQITAANDAHMQLEIQMISYSEPQQKLMLIHDVTKRNNADQIRRDFVANVSHEIRTPLTVLSGFIETMQQIPLDDNERQHYLQLMAQQSTRMHQLISDLLTLARLEGSQSPDMESTTTIDELFAQTKEAAQELSHNQHLFLFKHTAPLSALIIGEPSELLSALGNLVSNAIRYTPAGSQITITWSINHNNEGVLCVADNGPGIDAQHLERLTERFYRIDRSRSRQTGGTGLGLSIVKHIMQRHSGTLKIESTIGQGSRFYLLFPANRVQNKTT